MQCWCVSGGFLLVEVMLVALELAGHQFPVDDVRQVMRVDRKGRLEMVTDSRSGKLESAQLENILSTRDHVAPTVNADSNSLLT